MTIMMLLLSMCLTACHESLEERTARECKEYTEKYCPVPVAVNVVTDSMVFEPSTKTIIYYYTLSGPADTLLVGDREKDLRKSLLSDVANAPNLMNYKEAGFQFRYVYFSKKNRGRKLYDFLFTQKDY